VGRSRAALNAALAVTLLFAAVCVRAQIKIHSLTDVIEGHSVGGVTIDLVGNIYVADWGNNRVQVLDPDGRFRVKLLGDAGLSKWAQEFLPANPDYMEARTVAKNRETERFLWGPTAVKFDTAGHLYIVDSCRYRIQIYRRSY